MKTSVLLLALLTCVSQSALAQSVGLAGILGGKALLIVDGSPPKVVAAGESFRGVKVLSMQSDTALVEAGAHKFTIRLGDAPSSMGSDEPAAGGGKRIVLSAGGGGHFFAAAQINGATVQTVIDTGATSVSITTGLADRLGIKYRDSTPRTLSTANGTIPAWAVKLNSLRVGDVTLYGVDAVVSSGEMPYVLLGNTFLSHFQMTRINDQMVLEKRY
jgi:aspartyl protease family protein